MSEKIMTLHPEGKAGANISQAKYDAIKATILDVVGERGVISFVALVETVAERLGGTFDGSIPWYVTTVKLDLEARQLIERVPGQSPQQLRLSDG